MADLKPVDKERLKELRAYIEGLKLRFPNKEIVEKTGINKGNVSNYINGEKPYPDSFLKTLYKHFGQPETTLSLVREDEPIRGRDGFSAYGIPREIEIQMLKDRIADHKSVIDRQFEIIQETNQYLLKTLDETLAKTGASIDNLTNEIRVGQKQNGDLALTIAKGSQVAAEKVLDGLQLILRHVVPGIVQDVPDKVDEKGVRGDAKQHNPGAGRK